MPTPNQFGYTSTYHMPVIPAPTDTSMDSAAVEAFYTGLGIDITPEDMGNAGLKFEFPNETLLEIYALTGGTVKYIPAGGQLPGGGLSPGEGSILLETSVLDILDMRNNLPGGIPPMSYTIYMNIIASSARTALESHVDAIPEKILNATWTETETSDPLSETLEVKKEKFLDRVMLGEKELDINGGTQLGSVDVNASSNIEFTLQTAIGSIAGANATLVSPIPYLRNLPGLAGIAGSFEGIKWLTHPLITAIQNFIVPINVFVKFEVWNPGGTSSLDAYLPVDAGIEVKLMDADLVINDDLDTQLTNADGIVHFSFTDPNEPFFAGGADIYFKIMNPICSGINYTLPSGEDATFVLPPEWLTEGWKDINGNPGYYENFSGPFLGSIDNPLTFRIGVDFHLNIRYEHLHKYNQFNPVPKGVLVKLYSTSLLPPLSHALIDYSDYNEHYSKRMENPEGKLHGIVFDILPGNNLFFCIYYNMEDVSFNILKTTVNDNTSYAELNDNTGVWITSFDGADQELFNVFTFNTIGNPHLPFSLTATQMGGANRVAAFYVLKLWKELSSFLWYVTGGDWQGIELNVSLYGPESYLGPLGFEYNDWAPFSWPVGHIYLLEDTYASKFWNRSFIIHEMAHQLMWVEAEYSNWGDIALQFLLDVTDSGSYHDDKLLSSPSRALTEGWARAIEAIFENTPIPESLFIGQNLLDGSTQQKTDLGPSTVIPVDQGERSEAAFANGLFYIFWKQVVDGIASTTRLFESTTGDIAEYNVWIKNNQSVLSNRFKPYIWEPLKALNASGLSNLPESTDMLSNILGNSPLVRHKLLMEIERWNMRVLPPITVGLSVSEGPIAGGNQVQVYGYNFTDSHTTSNQANVFLNVYFGSQLATNINVVSSVELSCTVPPGSTSTTVDVKIVLNVRGHVIYSNSISYAYV